MLISGTETPETGRLAKTIPFRPVVRAQRGSMIQVAHIITGLGTGGAESMLLKLLSHIDRRLRRVCLCRVTSRVLRSCRRL